MEQSVDSQQNADHGKKRADSVGDEENSGLIHELGLEVLGEGLRRTLVFANPSNNAKSVPVKRIE